MRRRDFLGVLSGAAAMWPLTARAQQPRVPVVGFLSSAAESISKAFIDAFQHGLGESGYADGRDLSIEYRWADGQIDRLPALTSDLINRRVAVIAAGGPPAALAAKSATSTIPIVFLVGEATRIGLVTSLNRPGGNATGVSIFTATLWEKRLELASKLIPKAPEIAVLFNPQSPDEPRVNEMQAAAQTLGTQLFLLSATTNTEIDTAFATAADHKAGVLLVGADPLFTSRRDHVIALAAVHRLPAIYHWPDYVRAGGLMSYGTSLTEAWRQVGSYTGKILSGANPAELPVQQPTKFEFVINLKTAKALGLTVPNTLLVSADEVIE